jgi:hypothetical protein
MICQCYFIRKLKYFRHTEHGESDKRAEAKCPYIRQNLDHLEELYTDGKPR